MAKLDNVLAILWMLSSGTKRVVREKPYQKLVKNRYTKSHGQKLININTKEGITPLFLI